MAPRSARTEKITACSAWPSPPGHHAWSSPPIGWASRNNSRSRLPRCLRISQRDRCTTAAWSFCWSPWHALGAYQHRPVWATDRTV